MTLRLIDSRLSADCSFADNHGLAADPNLLKNSCTARECNANTTRPTHPDALEVYEPARLRALLHALNLEELPVFVFSPEPADDDATVYSRMFAPCFGIPEDPATGAASGPLGAYLLRYNVVPADTDTVSRLVNLQGARIGRPSRICIALSSRAGVLEEVRVGGEAVVVGEGTVRG